MSMSLHGKIVGTGGGRTVGRCAGLQVTNHWFQVPLDHGNAAGTTITLLAREVVAINRVQTTQPYLLYLQGGYLGHGLLKAI